jgi:hypothetical protein
MTEEKIEDKVDEKTTKNSSATVEEKKPGSTLILYYCKECKEIVEGKSSSSKKKYTFKCPTCKEICSYGSESGIISHFKIKESSENYQKIQKIKETRAQKKSEK